MIPKTLLRRGHQPSPAHTIHQRWRLPVPKSYSRGQDTIRRHLARHKWRKYLASGSEVLSSFLCARQNDALWHQKPRTFFASLLSEGWKWNLLQRWFRREDTKWLLFWPIREEHFLFFDQSEKSILHLSPRSSVARWEIVLKLENTSKIPHRLYIFIGLYNLYIYGIFI